VRKILILVVSMTLFLLKLMKIFLLMILKKNLTL